MSSRMPMTPMKSTSAASSGNLRYVIRRARTRGMIGGLGREGAGLT
ncbi:MAG: hypothetical protein LBL49_00095 [Clostridiales Family XIII bacterium]|nr:hypothetical protein [Clostridiales Family XIII bacterium]